MRRLDATAVTDANGNYVLAAIPGYWHLKVRDGDLAANNAYGIFKHDEPVTNYQPLLYSLPASPATAQLSGKVLDNTGAPVPGILLSCWGANSAGKRCGIVTRTLADGSYTLGVAAGTWHLSVNSEDAANRGCSAPATWW